MPRALGIGLSPMFRRFADSAPTILSFNSSAITDTAFTLSATIHPVGSTSVMLHYGLTQELLETPVAFVGSPITTDVLTNVSVTLSGLLPLKRYFFKIVATSATGVMEAYGNVITLQPVELTDGNWVAQYDAEYSNNEVVTNTVRVLADLTHDFAISSVECNPQPSFDASAGINLAAGITVSGGNLIFTAVANALSANFQIPVGERVNGLYRLELPAVSGRSGIIYNLSSSQAYAGGVAEANIPDGDYAKNICFNNNGYFYFRASGGNSNGVFAAASLRRILGLHAWSNAANSFPVLNVNQHEYDGVNDRLQVQNVTAVGTIYAFVRRIGTDSTHVMRNDFTGWGQFTSPVVSIGSNVAATTFYQIHMRRLRMRSVTDSAPVIAKLNEWFSRESYVVPPVESGVVGSGSWSDSSPWDDDAPVFPT